MLDPTYSRSLALHVAVAARLLGDPIVIERARKRVETWRREGTTPARYALAWERVLDGSAEQVAARIVEPNETMHELRQVSPFAGALPARERWAVLKSVSRTP